MCTPDSDLDVADRLLHAGNALEALDHIRRAQTALEQAKGSAPALIARLACHLIDCGAALGKVEPVREGLDLLESHHDLLTQEVLPYLLQYNIANAKKTIYDIDHAASVRPFNAASIASLTEAKDHYWQAYRLHDGLAADPQLLVNLANTLDQCCRIVEALRWYDEALKVEPGFAMAHLNRGEALLFLNRMSGGFSISQLVEARRSFTMVESSDLATKLSLNARERRALISSKLTALGWDDDRIHKYDEQHNREFGAHDAYWNFCLDHFLALSEHSLYCRCAGARRDNLAIPSASPVSGAFVPRLELLLNRMKSEFCVARALFYQAWKNTPDWDLHTFEGTFSELWEGEAIGLIPEFLRTSFRLCFGVLDRVAQGLSELYQLATPGEVLYFESFWRPADERKKGSEVRWEKINAQRNRGLVALYSIATDLNRRSGQWGFFKGHRNHLEHGLLVVLEHGPSIPDVTKPQSIAIEQVSLKQFRANALQMLQLTASALFSFVFCVREEGRRARPAGPVGTLEMGKKGIGKD